MLMPHLGDTCPWWMLWTLRSWLFKPPMETWFSQVLALAATSKLSTGAAPQPLQVWAWLCPGHGVCTKPCRETQTQPDCDCGCGLQGLLTDPGHKRVLWTQTQSYWPAWVTWNHHPNLGKRLCHISEQLFAMATPTGLIPTLQKLSAVLNSSHCKPAPTQTGYCFTNYHWLEKCTSAALPYLLQSTTKSHVHHISGFVPNWRVSASLWWFVDFRVLILHTQKRCIS